MDDKTKNKIVQKALEIIGTEGIEGLTVRKLAVLAGVNVGAVNYHFGSKKNLIGAVLSRFGSEVLEKMDFLDSSDLIAVDKLERFLIVFQENLFEYPGLVRSIFVEIVTLGEIFPQLKRIIHEVLGKLVPILSEITGITDHETCLMLFLQVIARIIYPVIVGRMLSENFALDFQNEDIRYRYIDLIIHSVESLQETSLTGKREKS